MMIVVELFLIFVSHGRLSIFKTVNNPNLWVPCDQYYRQGKINIKCDLNLDPIPNTLFYFDAYEKTWDDCRITAVPNGLTFASIRNEQENYEVADYLWSNNIVKVWLGGYQTSDEVEPAGNWAWLVGTSWTDTTYTNWARGSPDNWNNNSHHLLLSSRGTWFDRNKESKYPCIFRDPTASFA